MSSSPSNNASVDELLAQLQQSADDVTAEITAATSRPPAAPAGGSALNTPAPAAPLPADDFFAPPPAMPAPRAEVHRLLAIEVPVIVQLGMRKMTVGEVMRLAVGAIIEFHKPADEELDLLANNQAIGKGHAVKVGENFGIKVTSTGPVKDMIRKLGGV